MDVRILLLAAVLALVPCYAMAQQGSNVVIEGTVTDAETEDPLPGAHVFLSETTRGSVADDDGNYKIKKVTPGFHRLYVSMLGYESVAIDTLLQGGETYSIDLQLEPGVITAEELLVEGEGTPRDEDRWQSRFKRFQRGFIGTSERADSARILNPRAVFFDTSWWGRLDAEAIEPLVIENRALGYRLTYHLEEYSDTGNRVKWDGEPFFEELEPRDEAEAERWAENRQRAYYGSFRHFMQSLWDERLEREGFHIERIEDRRGGLGHYGRTRWNTSENRILSDIKEQPGDSVDVREMSFRGRLKVVYRRQAESDRYLQWAGTHVSRRGIQESFLEMDERPATIDEFGEIKETYAVTRFGYFAYERMGDYLPKDYDPTEDPLVIPQEDEASQ